MSGDLSAQREIAWAAAVEAQEAAGNVFDQLEQTIREALDVENQAINLVADQADTLEAEWDRLQTSVQAAIHTHSHLPEVPHHTHPDYERPSSFQDLHAKYDDVKRQAIRLVGELAQFAMRCETISFSPVGLQEWLSQLHDKYDRLARLSMNMILDRITDAPPADLDDLSMLLQEVERFIQKSSNDRAVDKLEDARQVAKNIEEQLITQLNLDDYSRLALPTVTRQVDWAERNIAAAQQRLNELTNVHSEAAVREAAQGIDSAARCLEEARGAIIIATTLLDDPEQDDSNAQLGLTTALQSCWEIDKLCQVVDRLRRK